LVASYTRSKLVLSLIEEYVVIVKDQLPLTLKYLLIYINLVRQ